MREIKFRAWDGEKMRPWLEIFQRPEEVVGGMRFPPACTMSCTASDIPQAVMQFTGLRDCNGVDVYESDIVTCYDWAAEPTGFFVCQRSSGLMTKKDGG